MKRRGELPKVIFLLKDSASAHISTILAVKLHNLHFQLVHHYSYSPGLVPLDYYLLPNLKKYLKGHRFEDIFALKDATVRWFEVHSKELYLDSLKNLQQRYN